MPSIGSKAFSHFVWISKVGQRWHYELGDFATHCSEQQSLSSLHNHDKINPFINKCRFKYRPKVDFFVGLTPPRMTPADDAAEDYSSSLSFCIATAIEIALSTCIDDSDQFTSHSVNKKGCRHCGRQFSHHIASEGRSGSNPQIHFDKKFVDMDLGEIEPPTYRMRSGRSTTELQTRTFTSLSDKSRTSLGQNSMSNGFRSHENWFLGVFGWLQR